MKKFAWLAVLILAGSLPGFASSIDFDSGSFQTGKMMGSFSNSIDFTVTGSLNRITVDTGKLTAVACPSSGMSCFDFTGGSVDVDGKLFKDALSGGLTIKGNGVVSINAALTKEVGVTSGAVAATWTFGPNGQVTAGSANVSVNSTTVTAEPASLMLFATGMLGVGALGKRRLRK
jgi:hypothetical protein